MASEVAMNRGRASVMIALVFGVLFVPLAAVPIPRLVEDRPPELVVALLPSLVRTIFAAFVEVMAEQRAWKA